MRELGCGELTGVEGGSGEDAPLRCIFVWLLGRFCTSKA